MITVFAAILLLGLAPAHGAGAGMVVGGLPGQSYTTVCLNEPSGSYTRTEDGMKNVITPGINPSDRAPFLALIETANLIHPFNECKDQHFALSNAAQGSPRVQYDRRIRPGWQPPLPVAFKFIVTILCVTTRGLLLDTWSSRTRSAMR